LQQQQNSKEHCCSLVTTLPFSPMSFIATTTMQQRDLLLL
jgi:hypothetical protein